MSVIVLEEALEEIKQTAAASAPTSRLPSQSAESPKSHWVAVAPAVTDSAAVVVVKWDELARTLRCSICLRLFRSTVVTKECLHRFCDPCIRKSLRLANRECPTCRTPCPSKRSTRADERLDDLLTALVGDVDAFEKYAEDDVPPLPLGNWAAFQESIRKGLNRQEKARSSRVNQGDIIRELQAKRQEEEEDEEDDGGARSDDSEYAFPVRRSSRRRGDGGGSKKKKKAKDKKKKGKGKGKDKGGKDGKRKWRNDPSKSRAREANTVGVSSVPGDGSSEGERGPTIYLTQQSLHGAGYEYEPVASRAARKHQKLLLKSSKPRLFRKYRNRNRIKRQFERHVRFLASMVREPRSTEDPPLAALPPAPLSSYSDSGSPSPDYSPWSLSEFANVTSPTLEENRGKAVRTSRLRRKSRTGKRATIKYVPDFTYTYSYTFAESESAQLEPGSWHDAKRNDVRKKLYGDMYRIAKSNMFTPEALQPIYHSMEALVSSQIQPEMAKINSAVSSRSGSYRRGGGDVFSLAGGEPIMLRTDVPVLTPEAAAALPEKGHLSYVLVALNEVSVEAWGSLELNATAYTKLLPEGVEVTSDKISVETLPQISHPIVSTDYGLIEPELAEYVSRQLGEDRRFRASREAQVSAHEVGLYMCIGDGMAIPLFHNVSVFKVAAAAKVAWPIVVYYASTKVTT